MGRRRIWQLWYVVTGLVVGAAVGVGIVFIVASIDVGDAVQPADPNTWHQLSIGAAIVFGGAGAAIGGVLHRLSRREAGARS